MAEMQEKEAKSEEEKLERETIKTGKLLQSSQRAKTRKSDLLGITKQCLVELWQEQRGLF